MDHATPPGMVSAFCRAVLSHLVPLGFWGSFGNATQNKRCFEQSVDTFVNLQRFANFSLHHVAQGLKVSILTINVMTIRYANRDLDFRHRLAWSYHSDKWQACTIRHAEAMGDLSRFPVLPLRFVADSPNSCELPCHWVECPWISTFLFSAWCLENDCRTGSHLSQEHNVRRGQERSGTEINWVTRARVQSSPLNAKGDRCQTDHESAEEAAHDWEQE